MSKCVKVTRKKHQFQYSEISNSATGQNKIFVRYNTPIAN